MRGLRGAHTWGHTYTYTCVRRVWMHYTALYDRYLDSTTRTGAR